jgi:hypothetical protein
VVQQQWFKQWFIVVQQEKMSLQIGTGAKLPAEIANKNLKRTSTREKYGHHQVKAFFFQHQAHKFVEIENIRWCVNLHTMPCWKVCDDGSKKEHFILKLERIYIKNNMYRLT